MLPAAAFLILFLAYPLGLGVWLQAPFTDARLGRGGEFVGFENYEFLWDDSTFWLSVFNTLLYGGGDCIKFAVGLYLAILLNDGCRSRRSSHGAAALLPCANRAVDAYVLVAV